MIRQRHKGRCQRGPVVSLSQSGWVIRSNTQTANSNSLFAEKRALLSVFPLVLQENLCSCYKGRHHVYTPDADIPISDHKKQKTTDTVRRGAHHSRERYACDHRIRNCLDTKRKPPMPAIPRCFRAALSWSTQAASMKQRSEA